MLLLTPAAALVLALGLPGGLRPEENFPPVSEKLKSPSSSLSAAVASLEVFLDRLPDWVAAERTSSPPSKRRDKKTNAEASKLRNNISMMEYEITRLNKSMRKRSTNLQALESQGQLHTEEQMQAVVDYNSEIQALHTQIARLTARQQGLKDEYYELTGRFSFFFFLCLFQCRFRSALRIDCFSAYRILQFRLSIRSFVFILQASPLSRPREPGASWSAGRERGWRTRRRTAGTPLQVG